MAATRRSVEGLAAADTQPSAKRANRATAATRPAERNILVEGCVRWRGAQPEGKGEADARLSVLHKVSERKKVCVNAGFGTPLAFYRAPGMPHAGRALQPVVSNRGDTTRLPIPIAALLKCIVRGINSLP